MPELRPQDGECRSKHVLHLYLATRSGFERSLTEAESTAIVGATPDEHGIILTEKEADVSRAAYIKTCMKVIAHAPDFPQLYKQLEEAAITSEEFSVRLVRFPRRLPLDYRQVMHEVGARIGGHPNLRCPKTTFLVVATQAEIWLGQVLSESDGLWNEHLHKARPFSSALPTRLARAMVNLVAAPGDSIIDPCCGSGTILIEAASMGIEALGCDVNPKLATVSIENLKHFGLDCPVLIADARDMTGNFDAVVTDLPYGRNSPSDEQLCQDILGNLRNLAPRAAVVTNEDMSELLLQMGYGVKRVIKVAKATTTLTRQVHVIDTSTRD